MKLKSTPKWPNLSRENDEPVDGVHSQSEAEGYQQSISLKGPVEKGILDDIGTVGP